MERFPKLGLDDFPEMTTDQLRVLIGHMERCPTPVVRMVEWPGDGEG